MGKNIFQAIASRKPTQAQVQAHKNAAGQQPAIAEAQETAALAMQVPMVGMGSRWWGLTDPGDGTMFMIEDGRRLLQADYPDLFLVIGTRFNKAGDDPATEMRLPDSRGFVGVGAGSTASAHTTRAVGETFGKETHKLTVAQMPSHAHSGNTGADGSHSHGMKFSGNNNVPVGGAENRLSSVGGQFATGATESAGQHFHSISSSGNDEDHNNIQPSIAVNYVIRVAY